MDGSVGSTAEDGCYDLRTGRNYFEPESDFTGIPLRDASCWHSSAGTAKHLVL